jgi:hypothetical protein
MRLFFKYSFTGFSGQIIIIIFSGRQIVHDLGHWGTLLRLQLQALLELTGPPLRLQG